ncbi:MAG: N-acetylmuramoyl-L-alanine amidase [Thermoanaerobaculia bacterium]|nr:MAG: N-acetylmuramoyl-L-alanine amidase [Thermoanaerobaculia bacterium]
MEKDVTLDLARRLAARLAGAGFEARLTRERDERILLADRARFANDAGADLFVSIHLNWIEDGRANRGIETFYLGPSDDPEATQLASFENRESGYSLADVRRLLDSIYADLRQEQSRALARAVQKRLLASVRAVAPEVRDRGVKSAPFLVLVATDMPAILAEVACLSNHEEARLLGRDDYRDRIAGALFEGIAAYSRSVQQADPGAGSDKGVR